MNEEKIKKIAEMLSGLKAYEWSRIKVTVDQMYSSASARIELNDAEKIRKSLEVEFIGSLN